MNSFFEILFRKSDIKWNRKYHSDIYKYNNIMYIIFSLYLSYSFLSWYVSFVIICIYFFLNVYILWFLAFYRCPMKSNITKGNFTFAQLWASSTSTIILTVTHKKTVELKQLCKFIFNIIEMFQFYPCSKFMNFFHFSFFHSLHEFFDQFKIIFFMIFRHSILKKNFHSINVSLCSIIKYS